MLPTRRFLTSVVALFWIAADSSSVRAAEPADILAGWIADAVPREYEKKEDWGRTRRVTVGLDASRRGLRLKKKHLPHGVWKHYRVHLAGADAAPEVQIEDLRSIAPARAAATVYLSAPLEFWGRTRIYAQGVHLGTYTAEGHAKVHLRIDCEIGVRFDAQDDALPSVIVEPVVHRAEVTLKDFQLERISRADGPAVHELAKAIEHLLEDELDPRKLTARLNRSIAKKQDRLRWDAAELMDLEGIFSNGE